MLVSIWTGLEVLFVFQGTERWTSKSSLLQVLISIQGTMGSGHTDSLLSGESWASLPSWALPTY